MFLLELGRITSCLSDLIMRQCSDMVQIWDSNASTYSGVEVMRITQDLRQYANGSFLRLISTILFNPNFHCIAIYRIANNFGRVRLFVPFSKLLMYINRVFYAVDIDYRADLAGGFNLIHGIGTVIGCDVKTDGPVKVYQGVTLGGNNNKHRIYEGREITQPWIMPNVKIYAHASIIGPCIVGENASIGANCIVTKDIDRDSTVFCKVKIETK